MNPQERFVLEAYLDRLIQIRTAEKDPEADTMIRRAVRQQPDAAYLLVHRALLLERALERCKTRIADLERVQAPGSGNFLEPGSTVASQPQGAATSPQAAAGVSPSHPPAPGSTPSVAGGASSFLGQAAATTAGVAGGAFLFEGLQRLFDHHSAFGIDPPSGMPAPADVTINNYYGGADRLEGDEQSSALDSRAEDETDRGSDDDYMI